MPGAQNTVSLVPSTVEGGDFENGQGTWFFAGLTDGIARVETEGDCFGANNTKGITFNGTRALNVRSSSGASAGSTGIATSSPFTLGAKVSFRALSENDDAIPAPDPVAFTVRLLSEGGTELAAHLVKANVLTTSPGTTKDRLSGGRDPRRPVEHAHDRHQRAGGPDRPHRVPAAHQRAGQGLLHADR